MAAVVVAGMSAAVAVVGIVSVVVIAGVVVTASAAVVVASAVAREAMAAPAVAVAPVAPGTDAEEDSVIEVARAVEAVGSASVGRIVVVAVGAYRWGTTDVDPYHDLSLCHRCCGE
jgi:hypothetical protein